MNTRKLTLLFTALVGLAVSAFAQSTATEATVARVTGTVTATLADGSSVAVTEGTKLPQGATITTGDKSEAYLVSHGDSTSVITANSVVQIAELSTSSAGGKVTEQKATLDLKSGNLVAKLNPAKKSVNQYSVRTPKGVAAARGTTFTVTYNNQAYVVSTINGVVSVSGPGIVATNLGAGLVIVEAPDATLYTGNLKDSTSLLSAATNELLQNVMAVAVATVTVAAQNGIGGTTATEAADVARTILAAVPGAAEQAGALINASNTANPPADPARAATVLQQVTTATPAAAQGAFTSGATTGTFTPSTSNTTTTTGRDTTAPENQTTTPTPIDPSTVSRSND